MDFRRRVSSPRDLANYRNALVKDIRTNKKFRQDQVKALADARLIYLTWDMAEVALPTGQSLTDFSNMLELIPSKSGLIWVDPPESQGLVYKYDEDEKPGKHARWTRGVFWNYDEAGYFNFWCFMDAQVLTQHDTREVRKYTEKQYGDTAFPTPMPDARLTLEELQVYMSQTRDSSETGNEIEQDGYRLIAGALTLAQHSKLTEVRNEPVAVQSPQRGAKPFRDEVSVINISGLREDTRKPAGTSTLTCRFIVGGHFRNQRYKNDVVKRIFIEPFIKGPAGAPMKVNRPVYKL